MKTVQERFNEKYEVNQETGCWEWTACTDRHGYGHIQVSNKKTLAHRVSYLLHVGEIEDGLSVCHRCDNPKCVNPKCLFLGTHKENMQDMYRKGRRQAVVGERTHQARLRSVDVRAIKKLLLRYPVRMRGDGRGINSFLARWFGVNVSCISLIIEGRNWQHIEVES